MYGQLTYNKEAKIIQWRRDSLFNKWCWENWTATCKKKEETGALSYIIHKNQFQMEERPKCKGQYSKMQLLQEKFFGL